MKKAKLLYVEDEIFLAKIVSESLQDRGYEVVLVSDGAKAFNQFLQSKPDVCVLDIMLPNKDGFAIADEIRAKDQNVPIIFLSAKSQTADVLSGFNAGANDYMRKPFSIEELILKIEIFLRRSKIASPSVPTYMTVGNYLLDHKNLSLKFADQAKNLTQKEADLLKMFIENKNEVIKRSYILETLWGEDDYFLGRSLDVFISRLRKYLSQDPRIKIENIHSVGFKMKVEN